ncbi:MAG: hypothetical protein ACW99A_20965 [Candidatus Kariarchaeaceae archaeon]
MEPKKENALKFINPDVALHSTMTTLAIVATLRIGITLLQCLFLS